MNYKYRYRITIWYTNSSGYVDSLVRYRFTWHTTNHLLMNLLNDTRVVRFFVEIKRRIP